MTVPHKTVGVLLLNVVCILWLASSIITQDVLDTFDSPFSFTYIAVSVFVLYFPLAVVMEKRKQRGYEAVDQAQTEEDDSFKKFHYAKESLVLSIMWFSLNLLFNLSLGRTSVPTATILSSTSSLFSLASGRLWGGISLRAWDVLSVVLA